MKMISELKAALHVAVAAKARLTRARVELWARTAGLPAEEKAPGTARFDALAGAWAECRTAKEAARLATLAYAFARGRRYWHVERATLHPPRAAAIARVAGADEVDVSAWLAAAPSDDERAAWDAHVAGAKAKARDAKAARRRTRAAE